MNIIKLFSQKIVAFSPVYVDLTGSLAGGVLLSQIMYWFTKKDTFFKTDADMIIETRLSAAELKRAKISLKELSFIKITRKGVPAKTWYEIDWDECKNALENLQTEQTSLVDSAKLDGLNSPNLNGEIDQTNTKSSSKSSSNISNTPKPPNSENQLSIAKPKSELTTNSENELTKSSESQVSAAVKLYFDLANKHNLPKIQKTTAEIQRRIKACIKALEADGSSWYEFLQIIDRSPHLIGQSRAKWFCYLQWIIKPANFEKIRDGNYLERTPTNHTENVFETMGELALEGAYDE